MSTRTLLEVASPNTLASLIADIQAMGTGASFAAMRLEAEALAVLVNNVGATEAERMIAASPALTDA